jgi:hypothetical protein
MALQSKTLLNDVGSAVLAEAVDQLNRAAGYIRVPASDVLGAGDNNVILGIFEEDVLITQVSFSFTGTGNINNAADDIALVTDVNTAGAGTDVAVLAAGYGGTDLADDTFHTMSSAQAGADGVGGANVGQMPIAVNAGEALCLRFDLHATSGAVAATVENITVAYRPVKDALNMQPAFTPKMANFKSVAR